VNHFVAREDKLRELQDALKGTFGRRIAVVNGLGGIGKTQLAIAYMKQHGSDYSARIWMNAKDETTLKQSYSDAAEWILRYHPSMTYIAGASQSGDLDETVEVVKRWLEEPENDRWLVIYDNYDNPFLGSHNSKHTTRAAYAEASPCGDEDGNPLRAFDLGAFLPKTDHGAIIVTTRSSMVELGQIVHLSKLEDINDSLEILASASGRDISRQGEYFWILFISDG
jgi:hypothetical protein